MDRHSFAERQFLRTEELDVKGEDLLPKIETLIHEGAVRRILLRNQEGHVLIEFPLPNGLTDDAARPILAAAAAIGALTADQTIRIEKEFEVFEDEAI